MQNVNYECVSMGGTDVLRDNLELDDDRMER